jgi:hypothetical protein
MIETGFGIVAELKLYEGDVVASKLLYYVWIFG